MRLTYRSLTLLLSAIGVQSFAPSTNRISSAATGRWEPSSSAFSASSANELSGILNEYKSGVISSPTSAIDSVASPVPVTTAVAPSDVEASMLSLSDAVNAATEAADQAAKAAAAAMASASKVSDSNQSITK